MSDGNVEFDVAVERLKEGIESEGAFGMYVALG